MIEFTFQLLRADKHLGFSETIDIAKGKYKLPMTVKEKTKQSEMKKAWKRKL